MRATDVDVPKCLSLHCAAVCLELTAAAVARNPGESGSIVGRSVRPLTRVPVRDKTSPDTFVCYQSVGYYHRTVLLFTTRLLQRPPTIDSDEYNSSDGQESRFFLIRRERIRLIVSSSVLYICSSLLGVLTYHNNKLIITSSAAASRKRTGPILRCILKTSPSRRTRIINRSSVSVEFFSCVQQQRPCERALSSSVFSKVFVRNKIQQIMADLEDTGSKNDKSKENNKINDTVPELDDTEPPKVIISNPPTMSIKITSNKLQKPDENKESDDCQIILPKTEIIDITDDIDDKNDSNEVVPKDNNEEIQSTEKTNEESKEVIETEVISEDEMPVDTNPIETEAVSEDELPPTTLADQIESVSDEELPSENSAGKTKRSKTLEESEKPDEDESQTVKKIKIEEVKPITEFDKLWQTVKDDPSDFAGWTYLLQYVDQEDNVVNAREAYNKFLELYPYCYGYWRKFADFEKRNNNKEECEIVFQRGLHAIPLSVDLWIHYMTFLKTHHTDDVDRIRSKFEKGLEMCGLEYRSDRLWDHYIKWEIDQNKLQNAFNIYNRLLSNQTLGHLQHFENFKEFVNKYAPDKILSVKEYHELRQKVTEGLRLSGSSELLTDDSAPPGEEENTFLSDVSAKETTLVREAIIELKQKIHQETSKEIAKRQMFEEGIKRPYFHVKPLEKCQIENWKDYIAFEKEAGDHQRIVILYERCLIPCALYEDFWLSYLEYLESVSFDVSDLLCSLFTRACLVHHRKSPELHLKWSAFEESKGNIDKAAEILKDLDVVVPHMLQIIYRRINLEKRRDQFHKVCELYEHYINTSHTKFLTSNIAIKYARFLWKCANKIDKAIEIITEIINKDKDNMQDNARLLLQLVELKMSVTPLNEKSVIQIFDDILSMSSVNLEQKILFSQRKLEFIEDYTCDYTSLRKATNEFKCYTELLAKEKKKASVAADEEKARIEKEMKAKQAQDLAASTSSLIAPTNYQSYNSTGYYPQQYATGYNQTAYQQYPPPTGQDYSYQYQNWNYPQANYNQTWGSYNYSGSGGSGSY